MTELSNQKADETKIIRIRITRSEPVGEPYRGGLPKPLKNETEECPKTELTGEMFSYQRKITFMKRSSKRMGT